MARKVYYPKRESNLSKICGFTCRVVMKTAGVALIIFFILLIGLIFYTYAYHVVKIYYLVDPSIGYSLVRSYYVVMR